MKRLYNYIEICNVFYVTVLSHSSSMISIALQQLDESFYIVVYVQPDILDIDAAGSNVCFSPYQTNERSCVCYSTFHYHLKVGID